MFVKPDRRMSDPHVVVNTEDNDRALLKAWEDMHASLIRLTRLFPHNPPPRDLAWEAEMEKWADLTRGRLGGSEELTTQGGTNNNAARTNRMG